MGDLSGPQPKKSLGQHWLKDLAVLNAIADCAEIIPADTVLEIGPGLGTLTQVLAERADHVIAVEFDRDLADSLQLQFPRVRPAGIGVGVDIINADFLDFDLSQMPTGYKIVGNIPYYITGKIVQKILTAANKPAIAVLLVQKEVADRIVTGPGEMSILAVAAQYYADVELGLFVPAAKFTPPPKVDSQVVILRPRIASSELAINEREFFHIVKAGFSQRRKKLRTALAGGLQISKQQAEQLLKSADIDPNLRAQDLSLADWKSLVIKYSHVN
ncbi:ribosomal RNA small subunit methyltransferase A [Alphaproteobacteria bacterium]|nr:ribosomal RNA small subunit methyltransferase A [Alphaproteobacteria bacterium]